VTASELNHLFGEGQLLRILFTHRPSELQLNRRQRIRELIRLSDLADAHSVTPGSMLIRTPEQRRSAVRKVPRSKAAGAFLASCGGRTTSRQYGEMMSHIDAPVSNLFLFGRKQDLAFEQPVRYRISLRAWRPRCHQARFVTLPTLTITRPLARIAATSEDEQRLSCEWMQTDPYFDADGNYTLKVACPAG